MIAVRSLAVTGLVVTGLALVPPPADASKAHVKLVKHKLVITGTKDADQITVSGTSRSIRVKVNGKTVKPATPIKPSKVTSIVVKARRGNDSVSLKGALAPTTVIGGPGDDLLEGGSGVTVLIGGTGNDDLDGGTGSATIDGGTGDDQIHAGNGPAVIHAGDGNDLLDAGQSTNVQAYGEAGNDNLIGGPGSALLDGGDGDDRLTGKTGPASLLGGDGNDELWAGAGTSSMAGGAGDDTYRFDGTLTQGSLNLVEATGQGRDLLDLQGIPGPHTLDLGSIASQHLTPGLSVTLSSAAGFDDVVGGTGDDTFTGNTLANRFTGLGGQDTYVHHGTGGGFDTVTDMNAAEGDQVSFVTGGNLSAVGLTLNAAATQLRDIGVGTYGFDFTIPVLNGASYYIFGTTDTSPASQLITFNGSGGFSQGTDVDSLILSKASNGATIGGAAGNDRIIDASPNGNSLVGRDGQDFMFGGDGDDTLQGDRGFSPGVSDRLTGGNGADTFKFGEAFGGGGAETFGNDIILDFAAGVDTVDLFTGLSVRSGLGTPDVVIWNGVTDFGTIDASNLHLWQASDFS